jgi:hypothetical protein
MGGLNQSPISKENITQTSLRKKNEKFYEKVMQKAKRI